MDPKSLPTAGARDITRVLPQSYLLLEADSPVFTVAEVSDVFIERTGSARDSIVGAGFFDVFGVDTEAAGASVRALAVLDEVVREGEARELGLDDLQSAGLQASATVFKGRHQLSHCVPLLDDGGQVELILVHIEDITELHREIEEALQSRYHRLFMQAPVGIALLEGEDFVCTLINDADLELFEQRDILGHSILDVFDEEELDPFLSELRHVYRTGEAVIRKEVPFQLREQRDEHFKTYAYLPFQDDCG